MFKLIKKVVFYSILILISLELLVRVFHLQNERPNRYADEFGVEKWIPNQIEYSITGNRKQNVGKYRINSIGFNTVYDTYNPFVDSVEIAIVGDSFIEGFHEDYTNSLGQQVDKVFPNLKVLEFGYAGYDLADELHLIKAYEHYFKNINHTFIYLRFTDDLERNHYVESSRLDLNSPIRTVAKQIKSLVYAKDIGLFSSVAKTPNRIKSFVKGNKILKIKKEKEFEKNLKRLENFKKLMRTYPIEKSKFTFLLDERLCSAPFLKYLAENNFNVLDYGEKMDASKKQTTLVYDQHWSKEGRKIVANLISDYICNKSLMIK